MTRRYSWIGNKDGRAMCMPQTEEEDVVTYFMLCAGIVGGG